MEAKVHEATNNEAWGASSTLMQEIAQATFNYQYFNEIMPTIYKRFTEKESKQWRQIYKALVLLEYLVKNGSERVVDDARSHISVIKMLKNFYYMDDKGKDQGLNVRNRSKELSDLLSDVDLIKAERKKAKKNRNKYTGVGSDGGSGLYNSGESSRYEGFGSDFMGRSSTQSSGPAKYNDFNSDFYDEHKSGRYDDDDKPGRYDEDDEHGSYDDSDDIPAKKVSNAKKKAKDLFAFDDDMSPPKRKEAVKMDDDWGDFASGDANDDFDSFQSTPVAQTKPPAQTSAPKKDLFDLLGDDDIITPAAQPPQPQNMMLAQAMSFETLVSSNPQLNHSPKIEQVNTSSATPTSRPATVPQSSTTNMGGIWSQASNLVSLDSLGSTKTSNKSTPGPSMNSLKNSSINAGWNNWASANPSPSTQKPKSSNAFDDLLF
ncbi:hypothetical protein BDB01DRAFT_783359 [Pilobolus umbonatus]|nr:hypothetical protein BDB01DRAFT_783359 [Pilobolus umbonatus]